LSYLANTLTDKQTNWQKHNLLGEGNKRVAVPVTLRPEKVASLD